MQWRARLGSLDPVAAGILPDLVCTWLDEGAGVRRVSGSGGTVQATVIGNAGGLRTRASKAASSCSRCAVSSYRAR